MRKEDTHHAFSAVYPGRRAAVVQPPMPLVACVVDGLVIPMRFQRLAPLWLHFGSNLDAFRLDVDSQLRRA